ncbi:MAG: MerC family mercury resistance protein [Deltaproteobacteria bacterium]|nr:MerC family mercury resistance protein [Kofleriaceae bacterium]MBK6682936.1 MerC family mercury resistance protein [Deltaproteobacteria bacterium]
MATVDLVYSPDCPNVPLARTNLMLAFGRVDMKPHWSEHRIGDPDAPEHTRGYGSPTILVDGRDVAGEAPSSEVTCRLYSGATRAPAAEQIAQALQSSGQAPTKGGARWRSSLGVLPGIGFAFLPKVACPACWPAYAGVLTSLGLGFLMDVRWLLPLTTVFLLAAVVALGFRARQRRGFGPLALGLCASAIVLAGKFGFESDAAMYVGLGMLVTASIWNTWPRRAPPSCPACTTN